LATLKKLKSGINVSYTKAELFEPLDFADFYTTRKGNIYMASIVIKARQITAFRNLSKELIKEFKSENLEFLPTVEEGAGYILGEATEIPGERGPAYSINESGLFRFISFGGNGASRKLFPEGGYKIFEAELGGLEKMANIFVNTVYKNNQEPDSIIQVPKDLIIEIN
jgi:hypothetical protein